MWLGREKSGWCLVSLRGQRGVPGPGAPGSGGKHSTRHGRERAIPFASLLRGRGLSSTLGSAPECRGLRGSGSAPYSRMISTSSSRCPHFRTRGTRGQATSGARDVRTHPRTRNNDTRRLASRLPVVSFSTHRSFSIRHAGLIVALARPMQGRVTVSSSASWPNPRCRPGSESATPFPIIRRCIYVHLY